MPLSTLERTHRALTHALFCAFISLLPVLGLCCCARAFSSCGEGGSSLVVAPRLLIAVASLAAEHRLRGPQASVVGSAVAVPRLQSSGSVVVAHGLSAPGHVGSSCIRDRTRVCCTGRWILYRRATREALLCVSK